MPKDAFEYFAGLGIDRNFDAVAKHYGVTSRAVRKRAAKEDWHRRLEAIDLKAREAVDKRAVETVAAMNERHLRSMRIVQAKALEALKSLSLESAIDAIRALDLATKHERVIRGEPGERTAVNIEEVVRREYENWLTVPAKVVDVTEVMVNEIRRERIEDATRGRRLLSTGGKRDAGDTEDADRAAPHQQGGALP
jgi:hypothetical protein